jgi:hypothetical protein
VEWVVGFANRSPNCLAEVQSVVVLLSASADVPHHRWPDAPDGCEPIVRNGFSLLALIGLGLTYAGWIA